MNERLNQAIAAENANIRALLPKLQRAIHEVLNNDTSPDTLVPYVNEWKEVQKRLNARGVIACLALWNATVVAAPISGSAGRDPNTLDNILDKISKEKPPA